MIFVETSTRISRLLTLSDRNDFLRLSFAARFPWLALDHAPDVVPAEHRSGFAAQWSAIFTIPIFSTSIRHIRRVDPIGIDLAKNALHFEGLDSTGQTVIQKRLFPPTGPRLHYERASWGIGMEACSGAHVLARALHEQGREVRLAPAQHVKPDVQNEQERLYRRETIAEGAEQ